MAPPAETTSSMPETPERKLPSRAAQILESVIKLQEEASLTPGTNKLADELRDRATASLDVEHGDKTDLDISWRIFEKLVNTSKAHAAEKKERSDKLAEIEKESAIDKARLQRLQLLLSEGDWAADIVNWVRHYETEVSNDEKEKYILPKIRAMGVHGDSSLANNKVAWRIMGHHQVWESLQKLEVEELKVKKWRDEGSDETKTPLTPALDRLDDMCATVGILRRDLLNIMKVYALRNEECHKKPPAMEKFVVEEGDPECDFFIDLSEKWWSTLVTVSPDGTLSPTANGERLAGNVIKNASKVEKKLYHNPPDDDCARPYKKGKWDDI
ncbi:hypothetical protein V8C35DRAFT_330725 [Trichoderma chlorosporum]